MVKEDMLVVTPEQLGEGFKVLCKWGGESTIKQGYYRVLYKKGDGNFIVAVPSATLFLGVYTNKPLHGEVE